MSPVIIKVLMSALLISLIVSFVFGLILFSKRIREKNLSSYSNSF